MFDEGFEIVDMCVDAVIFADIVVGLASHRLGVHILGRHNGIAHPLGDFFYGRVPVCIDADSGLAIDDRIV